MERWTKEDVYDEQIAPLMTQIIAICKEHRIPLVAQFNYAATDEDGPLLCTTIIPASAVDRYSDAISAEHDVAGPAYHEKHVALFAAIRALRAHREKVGR